MGERAGKEKVVSVAYLWPGCPQQVGLLLRLGGKRQAALGTCKRIIQVAKEAIIKEKTVSYQYQMVKVRVKDVCDHQIK